MWQRQSRFDPRVRAGHSRKLESPRVSVLKAVAAEMCTTPRSRLSDQDATIPCRELQEKTQGLCSRAALGSLTFASLLLDGRSQLTTSDVVKACRRFGSLREASGEEQSDPLLLLEEFQAVLYLRRRGSARQLHKRLSALQHTEHADVRVLLACMVILTPGAPEQQLELLAHALGLQNQSFGLDQLLVLLKANILLSCPEEAISLSTWQHRVRQLHHLFPDDGQGLSSSQLLSFARRYRGLLPFGEVDANCDSVAAAGG